MPSNVAPIIEVHTICWNEEVLLPLFLNHYSRFANKIVVWDNFSDDGSRELIGRCRQAELRFYDSGGRSSEDRYLDIKNQGWKGTKADWIIVCDVDELIYHEHIAEQLANSRASILRCDGFNVAGSLADCVDAHGNWRGSFAPSYCKPAIFRPDVEIGFGYGCHDAITDTPISGSPIKLLHCRYLGSGERLLGRSRQLQRRQSPNDVARNLAWQNRMTDDEILQDRERVYATAYPFPVIDGVRELQRTGAPGKEITEFVDDHKLEPPPGGCSWTPALVAEFFGEPYQTEVCDTSFLAGRESV